MAPNAEKTPMPKFSPTSTGSTAIGHAQHEGRYSSSMSEGRLEDRTATPVVAAPPIQCVECLRPWTVASERWRLKVLTEEDGYEAVPYCPGCATREFGSARSARGTDLSY